MPAFKKGDAVRQKVQVIEGEIKRTRFDEGSGDFAYLVEYLDAQGEIAERWFDEHQIETQSQPQPQLEEKAK